MTQATRNLSELIQRLMRKAENAGPVRHYGVNTDFVSFTKENLGGLLLTDDDARQYRQSVEDIQEQAAGKDEQISRAAVESIVQQTILKTLDPIHSATEKDFSKRLSSALAAMEDELREKPSEWEVYFPVDGLVPDGLPCKFGKCTFFLGDDAFTSSLEGRLNKVFGSGSADDDSIQKIIGGKTGVVTSVNAVDRDAAKMLGWTRIRQTVDILSFFANLGGSPRSQIVFAEDAGPKILSGFVFCSQKAVGRLPSERVGPIAPFSFTAPFLDRAGLPQACKILQGDKPNEFQERVISALQWAGRASVEPRNEEAFLLFAIALESLLMGRDDKAEITEKLALRAAHVIASPKGRLKVYKDVKKLYGIRSKIVHGGDVEVGESDLSLMRYFARATVLSMLCDPLFAKMTNESNLVDWFREQLLEIPAETSSPSPPVPPS